MSIVFVTATVKAKPGKRAALEEMLKSLLLPTHQETGCLLYALHRSTDAPDTFVFIEKWRSQDDLKKHMYSAHIRKALAQREEIIEDFRMMRLSPVAVGDGLKERF